MAKGHSFRAHESSNAAHEVIEVERHVCQVKGRRPIVFWNSMTVFDCAIRCHDPLHDGQLALGHNTGQM